MTSAPEASAVEAVAHPIAPAARVETSDRTNTLAIATFALALSGFTIIAQIAGIVTGHIALKQLKTSGERGHSLALWGLIISYVVAGLWILFAVFFFALWGVMFASMLALFGAGDTGSFDMMQHSDTF